MQEPPYFQGKNTNLSKWRGFINYSFQTIKPYCLSHMNKLNIKEVQRKGHFDFFEVNFFRDREGVGKAYCA